MKLLYIENSWLVDTFKTALFKCFYYTSYIWMKYETFFSKQKYCLNSILCFNHTKYIHMQSYVSKTKKYEVEGSNWLTNSFFILIKFHMLFQTRGCDENCRFIKLYSIKIPSGCYIVPWLTLHYFATKLPIEDFNCEHGGTTCPSTPP